MIVKDAGGFSVKSEGSGRNLGGPYKSKAQAIKRLRQVEYFKHLTNKVASKFKKR